MNATRTLQTTARRLVVQRPSTIAASRFASPVEAIQRRFAATTHLPQSQANDILIKQRLSRPIAPHLSIYKPQITWYASAFNRVTGSILSGAFYIFGFGYLVAPLFGWHWESASIAAAFAGLSVASKVAIKSFFAGPFVFHSINGLRHLSWDMTKGLTNKSVARSGWFVVGASIVGTLYLVAAY